MDAWNHGKQRATIAWQIKAARDESSSRSLFDRTDFKQFLSKNLKHDNLAT